MVVQEITFSVQEKISSVPEITTEVHDKMRVVQEIVKIDLYRVTA